LKPFGLATGAGGSPKTKLPVTVFSNFPFEKDFMVSCIGPEKLFAFSILARLLLA
jgi:hypothetical protein